MQFAVMPYAERKVPQPRAQRRPVNHRYILPARGGVKPLERNDEYDGGKHADDDLRHSHVRRGEEQETSGRNERKNAEVDEQTRYPLFGNDKDCGNNPKD
jgi:hypothetical protein